MKRVLSLLLLVVLTTLPPAAADEASSIVAVLSLQSGPYMSAFSAFRQEWGKDVPLLLMENGAVPPLPKGVRTVVAFGGKAALAKYPSEVDLVYCLSPGTMVSGKGRQGATVGVMLTPQPDVLAAEIKALQPGLRRLGILWHSPSHEGEIRALEKSFAAAGVVVVAEHLQNKDRLPDGLRRFVGRVEAIWIPPDPLLINEQNIISLREFSWANNIPFYAPTGGLVEMGAVASISIDFAEIGRAAARAAKDPRAAGPVHPQKPEIYLNPKAAAACGLQFTAAALKRARVVTP